MQCDVMGENAPGTEKAASALGWKRFSLVRERELHFLRDRMEHLATSPDEEWRELAVVT